MLYDNILIKKEFNDKLNELGIRVVFCINLLDYVKNRLGIPLQPHLDMLNKLKSWDKFIAQSFPWYFTSQGFDYWNNISQKKL